MMTPVYSCNVCKKISDKGQAKLAPTRVGIVGAAILTDDDWYGFIHETGSIHLCSKDCMQAWANITGEPLTYVDRDGEELEFIPMTSEELN
jgi:hypothetical protein